MANDNMTVVALDAMGGDYAPAETVKGAIAAVNESENIKVKLFGRESDIKTELAKYNFRENQIEIVDCADVVENCEQPTVAIRTKKDSSMVKGLYALRNKEADAFISCGNTGAVLVGGQIIVGRLKGIERPALAFIVPSKNGPVMIIDCGANVDARPKMLVQFAVMASVYMSDIMGIDNPRVGIINIGEEEEKGNILVQDTIPLLKNCSAINYVGSVESRGITEGNADIVVCDAFVGNIVLKMYEGVAAILLSEVKSALMSNAKTKVGAVLIKKSLKETLRKFSIEEYGGAPLLGLKSLVVKTHGSSKAVEIKNTILQCKTFAETNATSKIAANIEAFNEAAKEAAEEAETAENK